MFGKRGGEKTHPLECLEQAFGNTYFLRFFARTYFLYLCLRIFFRRFLTKLPKNSSSFERI
ncbi:MAG: hypothetical protein HRT90_03790 [Candidatus Margulisbacteria bacterium]|nr:hypothetical protein [Candidatus Margulisiibacteriota bacterium]